MSKYTPTTEEVRAVWCEWNSYGGLINRTGPEPTSRAGMAAEFDKWFASVQAEAWDAGALWAAVEIGTISHADARWLTPGDNPYRKETNDE